MLCAVSARRLTWRSEVICTDLKVTSSFQTGCACPMVTLVRFTWFSHCMITHSFALASLSIMVIAIRICKLVSPALHCCQR